MTMVTNTQRTAPRWMWWSAIALFVLNLAMLTYLWWTPLPDLSVIPGHTPEHDIQPYRSDP